MRAVLLVVPLALAALGVSPAVAQVPGAHAQICVEITQRRAMAHSPLSPR
jgi:hypothetical protein